MSKNYLK